MEIKIINNYSPTLEERIILDLGDRELVLLPSTENKKNAAGIRDFIAYFNTYTFTIIRHSPIWANIDIISPIDSVETEEPIEINYTDIPSNIKKILSLIDPTLISIE